MLRKIATITLLATTPYVYVAKLLKMEFLSDSRFT